MPDIHIHRNHTLGLARARQLASTFADKATAKFDVVFRRVDGATQDTFEFERSGVKGTLVVAGDHFDLRAALGFPMSAFGKTIEAEIEKQLDGLIAKA